MAVSLQTQYRNANERLFQSHCIYVEHKGSCCSSVIALLANPGCLLSIVITGEADCFEVRAAPKFLIREVDHSTSLLTQCSYKKSGLRSPSAA
ncbi:hypothetical protein ROHU_024812 [Labeo rohita]|uniref:Uncharacterized protein n=1 Tax=Labeo rohita TaxID=84645 RepID=A0A498MKJ3_LABRO|nr:hypothetical protein ROHU_024812 [Labeo rohita]